MPAEATHALEIEERTGDSVAKPVTQSYERTEKYEARTDPEHVPPEEPSLHNWQLNPPVCEQD